MPKLTFANITKFHPAVINTCKTIPEFVACMDTNLRYSAVEKAFNLILERKRFALHDIFIKYPNIYTENTGKQFIDIIEAGQATSFNMLEDNNVITGTTEKMRLIFKGKFQSMQNNPDVSHFFGKSNYIFQGDVGTDFKNIMGKTEFTGRNQVSVGNFIIYELVLNTYKYKLKKRYKDLDIDDIITKIISKASVNDWSGQVKTWAENMHKFPRLWNPSLFMSKNMPLMMHLWIKIFDYIKKNKITIFFTIISLFWIIFFVYFRLIKEKTSYYLNDLKGNVTDYFLIVNILFIILHIFLLCYAIYGIYTNNKVKKAVFGVQYIQDIFNIIIIKPFITLRELIAPHIPYSGIFFLKITTLIEKNSLSSLKYPVIVFNFFPRIIIASTFFIELIFFHRIKYFVYTIWFFFIVLLWNLFVSLYKSFAERLLNLIPQYI